MLNISIFPYLTFKMHKIFIIYYIFKIKHLYNQKKYNKTFYIISQKPFAQEWADTFWANKP